MHILQLDSIEPETYGGMEEWIRLVSGGLAARGHRVTVVGRTGAEFLRRVELDTRGVETLHLAIAGDFGPLVIARLRTFMRQRAVDIVTVNFNKDIRLAGIAARWAGRPRVIWRVGLDIAGDRLRHRLLTPRLVDAVITPSAALKKQIVAHGYISPEMVTVIPNGIPDRPVHEQRPQAARRLREKYGLPPAALVAVTSGRFVDQKGHAYLVAAAGEIIRQAPDIRFLWLGDGPLETRLKAAIADAGLESFFVFAGMLRDFDLELAGSDFMLHPAVEEPFGFVLIEAMRAGLPVAATRVGGIPEVVAEGSSAVLFPPRDPAALAAAAVALACDSDARTRLGRAGRERFEQRFSADRLVDDVERFFLSQLEEAGQSHGTA
ncbi:MAG TPA: glycosyltransferase family 4 protein [candidate division Zixibacteria bacterium]|nr:glycosyltransferase family 4 protein [candidate division Zixibacteria bacterium]MDD4918571.1 glycosyltransferase family 4 protein [candidate division Zixibacteria bacterium]MDM7971964.1 glycosyltransferase family 4 protein [candidate division Zixibacteria bacterium]HOD65631.1 glycosyltransferase family 4 protein [candidate division Zixibacteria bacterium]HPC10881.1 glycosyltransferase family 4 protein [candidate division Zixibacteria bacterium]